MTYRRTGARNQLIEWVTFSVYVTLSVASRDNHVIQQRTCSEQLARIYTEDVTSETPPHVAGLWTSQRCEICPGPEYVLRQYRFHDGGLFDVRLFFYSDPRCQNVSHSLTARGQLRPYQLSWIIPGAMELDYQLWHASVVPYTSSAAYSLRRKLLDDDDGACADSVAGLPWQPFELRRVYNYVDTDDAEFDVDSDSSNANERVDVDCIDALDMSVHELQLMRVERRLLAAANGTNVVERSLLLGDIHTSDDQRQTYRPMGFQEPLVLHGGSGCTAVCDTVAKATEYFPPHLTGGKDSAAPVALSGAWVSRRCEARSYGVFVTRHFEFVLADRKWTGRHNYFADIVCQRHMYTVDASGDFRLEQLPSDVIDDAYHIDFNVTKISMSVFDKTMLNQLSAPAYNCGRSEWRPGQSQDVTNTSGCPSIGVVVATHETDIVRIERRGDRSVLYLGQRPTDGSHLADPARRPTSFQPGLVRCSTADAKSGAGRHRQGTTRWKSRESPRSEHQAFKSDGRARGASLIVATSLVSSAYYYVRAACLT